MKIKINVLPDGEKERIRREKKIGFALKLVFSFVAVLLLVNTVLYLMQIVLGIEYQAARKASEKSYSNNAGKESNQEKIFLDTNKQVANITKINSNIPKWARVLARISELSPEGIRMNKLTAEGTQLKISGFSKTRDDFLSFQNGLRAEGFEFSVDLSNLVASTDFDFELEINIPQDYLNRK